MLEFIITLAVTVMTFIVCNFAVPNEEYEKINQEQEKR